MIAGILAVAVATFTGNAAFSPQNALLMASAILIGLLFYWEFSLTWKQQLAGAGSALVIGGVLGGVNSLSFLFPFAILLASPPFLIKARARVFKQPDTE